jgi:hypothetical protein
MSDRTVSWQLPKVSEIREHLNFIRNYGELLYARLQKEVDLPLIIIDCDKWFSDRVKLKLFFQELQKISTVNSLCIFLLTTTLSKEDFHKLYSPFCNDKFNITFCSDNEEKQENIKNIIQNRTLKRVYFFAERYHEHNNPFAPGDYIFYLGKENIKWENDPLIIQVMNSDIITYFIHYFFRPTTQFNSLKKQKIMDNSSQVRSNYTQPPLPTPTLISTTASSGNQNYMTPPSSTPQFIASPPPLSKQVTFPTVAQKSGSLNLPPFPDCDDISDKKKNAVLPYKRTFNSVHN